MNRLFLSFFFFLSFSSFGQNYIEYQRVFNRIDEDIFANNYSNAVVRLDSIYSNYDFIFARHCFKSLQICCRIDDSLRANIWLGKCFRQGIPLWMIRSNDLTKKSLLYSTTQNTFEHFDSIYHVYKSSINQNLANQIESLLAVDQKYTKKVNDGFLLFRYTIYYIKWLKNNVKQFKIINQITDSIGFPDEKIIGLPIYYEDSANAIKNFTFWGPTIINNSAYIMLIHYFSNPRKDINNKLWLNVLNGNLPSYQYGALNDFMARWGKGKYGDYFYYNVWHHDPDTTQIENINNRRYSIGLQTFELQEQKNLLNRNRRKNKTANSEIITE